MVDEGSIKIQARWNISLETDLQREPVVFAANFRVRDGEAWRCLDPAGIPYCAWYRKSMYIKLEMEPPMMSSRIDLAQDRDGCRCHASLSTPIYKNMLVVRNRV